MNSRGALPYYTAAWVIGCFIFAAVSWIVNLRAGALVGAAQLLSTYFISLIVGAADSLLFAFLLRRVMHTVRTHLIWIWMVAGAGLAILVTFTLAGLGQVWIARSVPTVGVLGLAFRVVLLAPTLLRRAGIWYLPIEGAAMAAVLCLVDRAFDRPPEEEVARVKQAPA